MKRVLMLTGILVLFGLPGLAQSTLYYSGNNVVNGNGSITVTPTISMSWSNDIDYCDPGDGCTGEADQCFVMLTGNPWKGGDIDTSDIGCEAEYTFPNITVDAAGDVVDASYAGKVEGATTFNNNQWVEPAYTAFYNDVFVDGSEPLISPAPCTIPGCNTPWPVPWSQWPAGYHPADLGSVQSRLGLSNATTCYQYASVSGGTCTYNVYCPGNTPSCGNAPLHLYTPCPYEYVNIDWLVYTRGSSKVCLGVSSGGSATPADCS